MSNTSEIPKGGHSGRFSPMANNIYILLSFFLFTLWFGDQHPTRAGAGETRTFRSKSKPDGPGNHDTADPRPGNQSVPKGELPYGRCCRWRFVIYSYAFSLSCAIKSISPARKGSVLSSGCVWERWGGRCAGNGPIELDADGNQSEYRINGATCQ